MLKRTLFYPQKGFSLIEMLIVMALISILAMIALPQYERHAIRGDRAVALNVIQANILAIEQFRTQTGRYPNIAEINANSVIGYRASSSESGTSARFFTYEYTLNNQDLATITMNANLIQNNPSDAECARFTLNTDGVQTAFNANNQNNTAQCWLNR
jgi:type IV pilus assembly protein PilE